MRMTTHLIQLVKLELLEKGAFFLIVKLGCKSKILASFTLLRLFVTIKLRLHF